jgi:signal transduction histidine kinase
MRSGFSIRVYLTLSHAFLIVASLSVVSLIWSHNEEQEAVEELRSHMLERAGWLAALVAQQVDYRLPADLQTIAFPETHLTGDISAVYIDPARSIHNLTDHSLPEDVRAAMIEFSRDEDGAGGGWVEIVDQPDGEKYLYALAPVPPGSNQAGGMVCLALEMDPLQDYMDQLRFNFAGAVLAISIIGILVSTLLTRIISSRLADAERLAATVAEGDYHLRMPERGPRELQELSRHLNRMTEELDGQRSARQTILANVTHELARPLAGLKVGVESLRSGALDAAELADDLLGNMGQSIQRMEMLLDDIGLAARPQSRPLALERTSISIEQFLRGIASRYWTMAETRGIRIEVDTSPDLPPVFADERRLNQILGNLVDNAIKFTHRDRQVILRAEAGGDSNVRILVQDGGDGISEQDAAQLFVAFYQGENARRLRQGMGLGLAIASQLAEAHGGSLEIRNHPQGGAVAVLTLPSGPV